MMENLCYVCGINTFGSDNCQRCGGPLGEAEVVVENRGPSAAVKFQDEYSAMYARAMALVPEYPMGEHQRRFHGKMIGRKAWKARRLSLFARDNYTCAICLKQFDTKKLVLHHKDYLNLGWEDDDELTTLCTSCHSFLHGGPQRFKTKRKLSDMVDYNRDTKKVAHVFRKQIIARDRSWLRSKQLRDLLPTLDRVQRAWLIKRMVKHWGFSTVCRESLRALRELEQEEQTEHHFIPLHEYNSICREMTEGMNRYTPN